ncbi:Oligosaccharide translocation protein rft1 [Rhizopus azygosporus]|uniref:Man(5)GlcNAc(2)-PP-dolichol translocation protein RFT1 n=1 Tax=Rhizopus azygosporus TaxID=86630 RepID=A0A367IRM7_RHIAZ|nr:Oligosaccharide translocation protein rft1 [Rhizopus azygosporus]
MKNKRESTPTSEEGDLLSNTAKGASYLILLQFISRMLTFSLNQVVLRYTTPDAFGIASVNLELLASTILFISREGFRAVLTRSTKNQQQIVNLAYIPACLGFMTTTLCCGYYLSTISSKEADIYPYYRTSVVLYGLASLFELIVEPLFIVALNKLYFQLRVTVEGTAVILRCLVTFALTLYGYSILSFAIAQLVYGLVMMLGYLGYFLYKEKSWSSLLPRKIKDDERREYWFEKTLLHLGITMTKQSLLKHVLTEGDKMLISVLSTDRDKGVYGFTVNYGSLVARILFQPLEETGRTFFSKMLADKQDTSARQTAYHVLMTFLQFHILLGLLFFCFATNYTRTLVDLLAGSTWSIQSDAPKVLAIYCMYVPFMGVNGITEAFVQAIANKQDLNRLSYFMVFFSACFLISGIVFMHWLPLGAIGLVLANMVNLSVRIVYSWFFICRYFEKPKSIWSWFPHPMTTLSFVTAWFITHWSENYVGWYTLRQKAAHIGVGIICFGLVVIITLWKERAFISNIKQLSKSKRT